MIVMELPYHVSIIHAPLSFRRGIYNTGAGNGKESIRTERVGEEGFSHADSTELAGKRIVSCDRYGKVSLPFNYQ